MAEEEGPKSESVAPGAITALLREAFRAPHDEVAGFPVFRRGQVVGRFELVQKLGQGGFGVVYEAFDRALKRAVAFKAVRLGGDLELKEERLLREAEAAAQLAHPNIVTLHDVGQCEQGPYLVMELLRGRTLGERLLGGRLPIPEALAIAIEVARGIAHAHGRGVVHRDVTPNNVFLCDDGRVKVLDFGMALAFGGRKLHGGTVAYMAPEQWRGEAEDERTDVFALGVILYELLSGARPFRTSAELAASDGAPRLELPAGGALPDLVAAMLSKNPARRPRDCGEVLTALLAVERALISPPATEVAHAALRRSRFVALLVVAALAVAVAAALTLAARSPSGVTLAPPSPLAESTARPVDDGAGPAPDLPAAGPPREPAVAPARRERPKRVAAAVRYCRSTIGAVATPAPETGDGVLTVVADPFATVFVDGVTRGDTPTECRVAAGSYTVRAVHADLGMREVRVRVERGTRASWAADFVGVGAGAAR